MADDPIALLATGASRLGLSLDQAQHRAFSTYLDELDRWDKVARLTAYRSARSRALHLILESLLLFPLLPPESSPLLDIGSGPGVPGLILRLARPDLRLTLIEANRRRANFLRHVVRTLGLFDVTIHHARAEALAGEPALARSFRVVTLRAVAKVERALSLARPFVAPTGRIILPLPHKGVTGGLPGAVRRVDLTPVLPLSRAFLILG